MSAFIMVLQFLAGFLFAMVAGSVFGIWRGYDPTSYAAATFVEVHQGAVRGLNVLLPGLAFVSIALTLALAWFAWGRGPVLWLYLGAVLLMISGGAVTRLFNQPINAQIVGWTAASIPADWTDLRAAWWHWHLARTGLSLCALALLLTAIISDRPSLR